LGGHKELRREAEVDYILEKYAYFRVYEAYGKAKEEATSNF